MKHNCFGCKHFKFVQSTPDWSEWTPGADASIRCGRDHFDGDPYLDDMTEHRFYQRIRQAEACHDFEEAVDAH